MASETYILCCYKHPISMLYLIMYVMTGVSITGHNIDQHNLAITYHHNCI